jgi:hypothetical protein
MVSCGLNLKWSDELSKGKLEWGGIHFVNALVIAAEALGLAPALNSALAFALQLSLNIKI